MDKRSILMFFGGIVIGLVVNSVIDYFNRPDPGVILPAESIIISLPDVDSNTVFDRDPDEDNERFLIR